MTRVTVWNEYLHERENEVVASIYPDGIHAAVADAISADGAALCRTATLQQDDHGLPDDILTETDVLVWWGHKGHHRVDDRIVDRVYQEVLGGMGLIVLHSGHFSKIFRKLMGTNCSLKWREADEKERLWNLEPSHPIMDGIGDYFELEREEMYGERFDVPPPDELLMVSWFQGGEVFRSLCTWQRGHGRVVYFRPGHETYPTYHDPNVRRIIANAARWARRRVRISTTDAPNTRPLEAVPNQDKTPIV
ncbi:MAG: ThuA domain-containing protein [Rhodothermales bacterium]|nr:ThuA domain-containing protein [Rhodothermales bacterium]